MSDYRNRRSPYEQGELKFSPERHGKKKKSKKSKKKYHQLPPEAKPYIHKADDDDDVQIIEAVGHGEEEGGSLTIKPPQAHIPRPEKSHKHKKDKHRARDLSSDHGRDRFYQDGKQDKHREFDGPRDFRDAREIVKERKKERELKEKEVAREMTKREARKREESIKERERLERMELERRRERQMREDRHHEEKESRQQKRKEDRRNLLDNKRERGRDEDHPDDHSRSRSRDQVKSKEKSRSYGYTKGPDDEKGSNKKEPSRATSDRPRKTVGERDDHDTRRVVVDDLDDGGDRKKTKRKDYEDDVIMVEDKDVEIVKVRDSTSAGAETKQEKSRRDEGDAPGGAEEESEEESDSSEDSDSDSGSSEEEDSSEEEEEDEEEEGNRDSDRRGSDRVVDRTDDGRGKVRSKFDDHSDIDSPEHPYDQIRSDDNYLPESPEMSDVEENLEDDLPLYLPAIQGCRSVEEFNCLNRIEEGTYGVVYRAKDKKTNEIVALKRLKMEKEKEGFPITSLREVNTLLKSQHENIVTVREIVVGSNMDKIYIVMDFVEHDLKSLMENMKNPFLMGEVKTLLKQLLRAVRHMHDNWILHRDLKTSNLLLSHKGILKVGDFGLAREYGSPLRNYTPIVVTLWYRSPELLLGCKKYSTLVDMWSVGCIFAEFMLMKALWPGKSEIDQINRIFKDLGTPTEEIWPGVMDLPGMKKVNFNDNPYNVLRNRFGAYFTDCGFDLLNRFFAYDPLKRITAEKALVHEYFSESPLPVDPSMFPTWPARSEQTKKTACSPKPPSGGKAYQKLMDDEEHLAAAGGFHMSSAAKGVSAQGFGFSLKF